MLCGTTLLRPNAPVPRMFEAMETGIRFEDVSGFQRTETVGLQV